MRERSIAESLIPSIQSQTRGFDVVARIRYKLANHERNDTFHADAKRHPDPLVQHLGGFPEAVAAAVAPRDETAGHAGDDDDDFPGKSCHAGDVAGTLGRDPVGGAGNLCVVAADAVVTRGAVGEGPPNAGAHLLQVRGRQPGGQPQTEHDRGASVLQQGRRHQAARDGDGRGGQWGSSLALACRLFGLECTVYMVKVSFEQKPYHKLMMQTWGAEVFASPSDRTEYGRKLQRENPGLSGQPRYRHQRSHRRHGKDSEHKGLAR